ncbi:DUF2188 domain-containing protein [Isoptericola sediminis]|uniref:DUF2188 domain-containing protein n=1 Tax=Isoptericola sediminis TaxID=2733572 RepID=A0A849JTS9_9MICO|nr:DUF2188 domain-containing protein [Isoptericola sediminis]NNU26796.1 DUF2188 domain-containing protein [Isoptericola sediminis]
MAKGDVHTSWDADREKWVNRREGNDRPSSSHDRADDASSRGQDLARNTGSEWIKHRKDDGRIHDRNTYGKDPYPPKG